MTLGKREKMRSKFLFCAVCLLFWPLWSWGQSIVNTEHNLSVSGPGSTKATTESEVCIFCHTPHNSSPQAPLWNRKDPGQTYTLYSSSTIQAVPGQPDGSSILCLSCHDGTVALGDVLSRASVIEFNNGVTTMPAGPAHIGTNLSDDHPVSFVYDNSLAAADGELADPANLNAEVRLENGKVQCTSCHDAHKDIYGDFLVASAQYSTLCGYCHQKTDWSSSAHNTSPATWNGSGSDPWFHTDFNSVSENACENCHNPHTAEGAERLTNYLVEESNCLNCHNGNVASGNIESALSKPYTHDVYSYDQIHDDAESKQVQTMHVECVDCHNPHKANSTAASAPNAGGAVLGARGIDTNGNPVENVQYEYELCYRCHAGSAGSPGSAITRQIEQNNTRLEFDLNNPSYHPVEGVGRNANVPSLITPYTENSVIYCTDCHASNDATDPAGPHGSIYPYILKFNYETADYTKESYQNYELCYQCHDRNAIINDTSTKFGKDVHRKHIVGEDAPCSTCHDPHGISSNQGTSQNNTHLINFNTSVVSSVQMGRLEFVDEGDFAGKCYLRCHGRVHKPKSYK